MAATSQPPRHSLASARVRPWRVGLVTAAELLEALRAIPGVKALAAGRNGIAESRMVAGIEVARMDSADDKLLRKAWRDRTKGGPTPLLMLTDAPDETQT